MVVCRRRVVGAAAHGGDRGRRHAECFARLLAVRAPVAKASGKRTKKPGPLTEDRQGWCIRIGRTNSADFAVKERRQIVDAAFGDPGMTVRRSGVADRLKNLRTGSEGFAR